MRDQLTELADRVHGAVSARMDTARYWMRNAGRLQPPIEMVRLGAYVELRSNPTITAYKFVDGKEVRRSADPFARFKAAFDKLSVAAQRFTAQYRESIEQRNA